MLGSNLYPSFCLYFTKVSLRPKPFFLIMKKYLCRHADNCSLLTGIYLFYENWSTESIGKDGEETSSFERVIDDARLVLWRGSPPTVPNETDA